MHKDVYTIPEIARLCSVGRSTIWRWVKSEKLGALMTPGGQYRVLREDLEYFLSANGMRPIVRTLFPKKVILVVDDDVHIQGLFVKMLSNDIYQVHVASDGFEAGQRVMDSKPDLLILGLTMPGMDGFEVCKRIKEDSRVSHMKVLAITGHNTEEDGRKLLEAGADGYLAKPVKSDRLIQIVENLLNGK